MFSSLPQTNFTILAPFELSFVNALKFDIFFLLAKSQNKFFAYERVLYF